MAIPSLYRSTEDYLLIQIQRLQNTGSKITDFTIGSGTRSLFEAIAAGWSEHSAVAEQHRVDSYFSTATGDALTARALDQGVERKAAVKATGTVRITRDSTAGAVTIPAGWSALSTVPAPGTAPVQYVTLEDAVLGIGVGTVDVDAEAIEGGTSANIDQGPTDEVTLLPANPVPGFATDGDFTARGPFINGVDEEDDDRLRARVPIEVQGRVKGKREALLAAALRIPGCTSAQIRQAGETDHTDATIPGGTIRVYYEGDPGLLSAVTAEVEAAAVLTQNVIVANAAGNAMTVDLEVFVLAGLDPVTITAAVKEPLLRIVELAGAGEGVRFSDAVRVVHDGVPDVQSIDVPFTDFRLTAAADNTCADIPAAVGKVPTLASGDITVTVTEL